MPSKSAPKLIPPRPQSTSLSNKKQVHSHQIDQQEIQKKMLKFSSEIDNIISYGVDYDKACQNLLDDYKHQSSEEEKKQLTKIWYSKILNQEMKEQKVRKSTVMEKPWTSPPREQRTSLPIPQELIKNIQVQPQIVEQGFNSRFTNNDNYKNHRQRVAEEQKKGILKQIEEKRQKQEVQKLEHEMESQVQIGVIKAYPQKPDDQFETVSRRA